jgi:hypothetical protein
VWLTSDSTSNEYFDRLAITEPVWFFTFAGENTYRFVRTRASILSTDFVSTTGLLSFLGMTNRGAMIISKGCDSEQKDDEAVHGRHYNIRSTLKAAIGVRRRLSCM